MKLVKQFTNKNKFLDSLHTPHQTNLHLTSISKMDFVHNEFVLNYIPPEEKAFTLDLYLFSSSNKIMMIFMPVF